MSTIDDSFHVEPEDGLETRVDGDDKSDDCQVFFFIWMKLRR